MSDKSPEQDSRAAYLHTATVKALKQQQHCSWKAVANACGVHHKTVMKWVAGVQAVYNDNLLKLAEFFGCTPQLLIGEELLRPPQGDNTQPMTDKDSAPVPMRPDTDKAALSAELKQTQETIELIIRGEKGSWSVDRLEDIYEFIIQHLKSKGFAAKKESIVYKSVQFGSIHVTFEMPQEWAAELERAAKNNELSSAGIVDAAILFAVAGVMQARGGDLLTEQEIGQFQLSKNELLSKFAAKWQPLIKAICLRYGLQDADAEDVAATILIRYSERDFIAKIAFQSASIIRHWVLHDVFNAIGKIHRYQWMEGWSVGNAGAQESLQQISARLEAIPENSLLLLDAACKSVMATVQRTAWQAFLSIFYHEKPVDDIAGELGMSKKDVYKAAIGIRRMLRKKLRDFLE